MTDKPLLTFVIPTFNRPAMLIEAVESCLNQTIPVDVLVVDHGSSIETRQACEHFPPSVRVIRRERDSGPVFAWLDGVLHADTDLVNLHFDDDLKHPRFAESCTSLMRDGVGMVFSQARICDSRGTPTEKALFDDWLPDSGVYLSTAMSKHFRRTLVSPCASVYRRQHLVDSLYVGTLPNQNSSYHGVGPDLYVQLLAQSNYKYIGYVAKELVYFRAHPGSITIDAIGSERKGDFRRAYDEARLAILDIKVARLARWFRIQELSLVAGQIGGTLRRGLRKLLPIVRKLPSSFGGNTQ